MTQIFDTQFFVACKLFLPALGVEFSPPYIFFTPQKPIVHACKGGNIFLMTVPIDIISRARVALARTSSFLTKRLEPFYVKPFHKFFRLLTVGTILFGNN